MVKTQIDLLVQISPEMFNVPVSGQLLHDFAHNRFNHCQISLARRLTIKDSSFLAFNPFLNRQRINHRLPMFGQIFLGRTTLLFV
jgi:hypothetical protein